MKSLIEIEKESILNEEEVKEAISIGESILAYITRRNTCYAVAEKSLEIAIKGIKKELVLKENN
ncbi:MAG: hypothetical protein SOX50_03550 [Terrisporobacter othiniensis]|uniref:hypothetical protein n=1 Tax=Terrisporobacter othiniensis TaxID=1577792 RepID=UPI002A74C644|nr:hypothetical protein [Terrisporobacter othiniensis]MDY3372327.1 hypothetical protein [Terrisporobacter othiniensis]